MPTIVVGAGIGGVTAAIALLRSGVDVEVYEAAETLAEVGAGLSLMPNGVRVLDRLGIGDAARRLSGQIDTYGLRAPDGRWLRRIDASKLERRYGAPMLALHRADLHGLLVEKLPDGVVRLGSPCARVTPNRSHATVHLPDEREVSADAVIGADGLNSVARRAVVGDGPPRYLGYTSWRGVTGNADGLRLAFETWGRGARFGAMPIRAGQAVYWFATANAAEGGTDTGTRAALESRFGSWHAPIPELLAATDDKALVRTDIYERPRTPTWTSGRIALLGDAAHAMAPNLGQGASQAMEDAEALAANLTRTHDLDEGLKAYEGSRKVRADRVVRASRLTGWLGQRPSHVGASVSRGLARLAPETLSFAQLDRMIGRSRS
jgi:2-polyprenyl-6-methoxyphenol hydroxylase-like FAD-dependent oxidoreductase